MKDNLIILAAGTSSRMKKKMDQNILLSQEEKMQANQRSKSLISIDKKGRPFLDYLLYNSKKAGYKSIYIVTQKENELFKSMYGKEESKNSFHGLKINFAIQYIPPEREKPLGTSDALYQTLLQYPELKTSSFTVCNSDNLYSKKALELLRIRSKVPNVLLSYDRAALKFSEERISKFALMIFDKNDYLTDIVEKPAIDLLQNFKDKSGKLRVSMNIFKFDGNLFFQYLENCPISPERNEKELPTALLNMIKDHPKSVLGIPISEHVPDLTSQEDILILKEYLKNSDLSDW